MSLSRFPYLCLAVFLSMPLSATRTSAAELSVIEPGSEPPISGKEVDWIYGDYLLTNDQISLVVAAPLATRDANMTTRNIGASILDLTLNQPSNDQLSVYTPTAGRYLFQDPSKIETGRNGDTVFWQCGSSKTTANDGTVATVRYDLASEDSFVKVTVSIEGKGAAAVKAFDGVRADGWFVFETLHSVAYCEDAFARQTIGFMSPRAKQPPTWKKGRPSRLLYSSDMVERTDGELTWVVHVYPATSPIDLRSAAEQFDQSPSMVTFQVTPDSRPDEDVDWVNRAQVLLRQAEPRDDATEKPVTLQTDDEGVACARLVPGDYVAVASAIGHKANEVRFVVTKQNSAVTLPIASPSGFYAEVTDDQGTLIPFKATIYRLDGDQPDFGPSTTRTLVENLAYSVHGRLRCPLEPGKYEIYFSRGPEYNSQRMEVEIQSAKMSEFKVQLARVVNTEGWVSADLHSHSSPSGDNTSDQYGRVENLLCEQVEFAPCTEHNRVSSYSPHLQEMQLEHLMATCTGIEVTGSPLPVNHQNAFPLHHHPHTQNGGGPRTASNPVVQIERLAMWDEGSEKVVQMNHPNLHQIYGDLDVDGVPDQGFRGMLEWTDVIEVHPLETIFQDVAGNPPGVRRMKIPMFQWLQLLNQGERIPGVINTDSHYNHHGSGWRRIWIASSADDPAKISTHEMVHEIEAGHIVMSTGPFLSVVAKSSSGSPAAIPGDDLVATNGKVTLEIGVQCPNWLDINRVQVFVNGRPNDQHNYTRKNSPELFGGVDAVGKFTSSIDLVLENDAHVIVATIGEGMTMEKVMGRRYGKRAPIAISNPIFVDVDGNGFRHNGDELGLPLPKAK